MRIILAMVIKRSRKPEIVSWIEALVVDVNECYVWSIYVLIELGRHVLRALFQHHPIPENE